MLNVWQCRKTGDCCKRFISSGPFVTITEGNKIIENLDNSEITTHFQSLGITKDDVRKSIEYRNSLPIIKDQGTCVFLQNNECIIHQIKPKVCKDYPLIIEEYGTKTIIKVDLACPRGAGIAEELVNNRITGWISREKPIEVQKGYFYEDLSREKFGDE